MAKCYELCKREIFNMFYMRVFDCGHEILLVSVSHENNSSVLLVGGISKFELQKRNVLKGEFSCGFKVNNR